MHHSDIGDMHELTRQEWHEKRRQTYQPLADLRAFILCQQTACLLALRHAKNVERFEMLLVIGLETQGRPGSKNCVTQLCIMQQTAAE